MQWACNVQTSRLTVVGRVTGQKMTLWDTCDHVIMRDACAHDTAYMGDNCFENIVAKKLLWPGDGSTQSSNFHNISPMFFNRIIAKVIVIHKLATVATSN